MNDGPSMDILGLMGKEKQASADKAEILADVIDGLLGIKPKKTAVTDPELRELLPLAQLRHQISHAAAARGAEAERAIWGRIRPHR